MIALSMWSPLVRTMHGPPMAPSSRPGFMTQTTVTLYLGHLAAVFGEEPTRMGALWLEK